MRDLLVIKSGGNAALPEWRAAFEEFAPDIEVCGWDDEVDADRVRYALVWEPDAGRLARYRQLRLILSAAAGVDHILADPALPAHVPIVRMVTPETAERMSDFVVMAALALVRQLPDLVAAQRACEWRSNLTGRMASHTTAGVMGLGYLGAHAATRLAATGFRVAGWARSRKELPGVASYAGSAELPAFLAKTDILINLLPETPETTGILNRETLALLPAHAGIVNAGRGRHLDLDALVAALDSDCLQGAILDVFDTEPLPTQHPLWHHPKVIVTPHVASFVSRRARAEQAAAVIAMQRAGEPLAHVFRRERGY